MYKSKLQERCQKQAWSLPEYNTTKVGVDHNPRFHSTVVVNGSSFRSVNLARSSKEAQNDAAHLAFIHFIPPPPPPPPLLPPPPPHSGSSNAATFDSSTEEGEFIPEIPEADGNTHQLNAHVSVCNDYESLKGQLSSLLLQHPY